MGRLFPRSTFIISGSFLTDFRLKTGVFPKLDYNKYIKKTMRLAAVNFM